MSRMSLFWIWFDLFEKVMIILVKFPKVYVTSSIVQIRIRFFDFLRIDIILSSGMMPQNDEMYDMVSDQQREISDLQQHDYDLFYKK